MVKRRDCGEVHRFAAADDCRPTRRIHENASARLGAVAADVSRVQDGSGGRQLEEEVIGMPSVLRLKGVPNGQHVVCRRATDVSRPQ